MHDYIDFRCPPIQVVGSRADGTCKPDSDWDLQVLTDIRVNEDDEFDTAYVELEYIAYVVRRYMQDQVGPAELDIWVFYWGLDPYRGVPGDSLVQLAAHIGPTGRIVRLGRPKKFEWSYCI